MEESIRALSPDILRTALRVASHSGFFLQPVWSFFVGRFQGRLFFLCVVTLDTMSHSCLFFFRVCRLVFVSHYIITLCLSIRSHVVSG